MIADDRFPSSDAVPMGRLPDWHGYQHERGDLPASEHIGGVVSTMTVNKYGPGVTYQLGEPNRNGGFSALRGSMPRTYAVRPR